MTDNDIIKALEMCKSCECIESCPMFFNGIDSSPNCWCALLGEALTLINRQKAEIERLEDLLNRHKRNIALIRSVTAETAKKIKAEAIKEFAERLKEDALDIPMYGRVVREFDIEYRVKEMVGERE